MLPPPEIMRNWEPRFWTKVEKTEGCWEWTAGKSSKGYGRFKIARVLYSPHRLSWELANGEIPEGLCVLHECDNPPCVKPAHLFLGDQSDNMIDAYKKGRALPPKLRGEKVGTAKLTAEKVLEARRLHKEEGMNYAEIGRLLDVRRSTLRDAVTGRQWKHIVAAGPDGEAGGP